MKKSEVIELIKKKAKKHKVKLNLHNKTEIEYPHEKNMMLGGYFDGDRKELGAAYKGKYGFGVLLHESSHMDQWIENEKNWQLIEIYDEDDVFDRWITRKENYNKKYVNKIINIYRALELDCEKRTVEKIKKYKINLGIKKYIKNANAYIFLYTYMKKKRKWPDVSPSGIKEILDVMPDRFLKRYDRMSDKLIKLYDKHCYLK